MSIATRVKLVDLLDGLAEAPGDAIEVWSARVQAPGELEQVIAEHEELFGKVQTVVVDAQRLALSEADVAALSRAARGGVRVVLAGANPVGGVDPSLVLYESEFDHAVVASLYSLDHGRSAIIASPGVSDSPALRGLVRHAMLWRASWQEAEEGDFASRPA